MATREEKQAAQEQLHAAVENIFKVYDANDDGSVMVGWVLSVAGSRFLTPDDEEYDEDDSELETMARHSMFYQDGQHPYMSRGITERTLDRLRDGV